MSIKISFKRNINPKNIKNYVLFVNENFKINGLNKLYIQKDSIFINKVVKSSVIKKKQFLIINLNSSQKIILIQTKNSQSTLENEKKGADFFNFIKLNSLTDITFLENNIKNTSITNKLFLDEFLHGLELKSYKFNKYKSKKEVEIYKIFGKLKTEYLKYTPKP